MSQPTSSDVFVVRHVCQCVSLFAFSVVLFLQSTVHWVWACLYLFLCWFAFVVRLNIYKLKRREKDWETQWDSTVMLVFVLKHSHNISCRLFIDIVKRVCVHVFFKKQKDNSCVWLSLLFREHKCNRLQILRVGHLRFVHSFSVLLKHLASSLSFAVIHRTGHSSQWMSHMHIPVPSLFLTGYIICAGRVSCSFY